MYRFRNIIFMALVIVGCGGPQSENAEGTRRHQASYVIADEVKSETASKAQLITYAVYTDSIYTKEVLEHAVREIYDLSRKKHVFENHDTATVLAVYLFTSMNAVKDKANWIAMLVRGPNDVTPRISFNDFKVSALSNSSDNIRSEDEIALDKLKAYLHKRGLDLCSLAERLKQIELENIHKADARYLKYGEKHLAMVEQLDAQSYKNLRRKYKIKKGVLGRVALFAMAYCK